MLGVELRHRNGLPAVRLGAIFRVGVESLHVVGDRVEAIGAVFYGEGLVLVERFDIIFDFLQFIGPCRLLWNYHGSVRILLIFIDPRQLNNFADDCLLQAEQFEADVGQRTGLLFDDFVRGAQVIIVVKEAFRLL